MSMRDAAAADSGWMIVAAAAAGVLVAVLDFFSPDNGIHFSGGALLVVVSSALILAASVLLAFHLIRRRSLAIAIEALVVVGIIGTGAAAYFLEADLLLVLMVLALIFWCGHRVMRGSASRPGAVP